MKKINKLLLISLWVLIPLGSVHASEVNSDALNMEAAEQAKNQGHYQEAVGLYNQLSEVDPAKLTDVHLTWAESLMDQNMFKKADVHVELALKYAAQAGADLSLKTHQRLVKKYMGAGQIADAIYHQEALYQHYKSLKDNASYPSVVKSLSKLYIAGEEFEKAKSVYPLYLEIWDKVSFFGMIPREFGELEFAMLQMKTGDLDSSSVSFEKIIASTSKAKPKEGEEYTVKYATQVMISSLALMYRADLERKLGHPQAALKFMNQFKVAADKMQKDAAAAGFKIRVKENEPAYHRALTLMQVGEDEQALVLLKKSLTMTDKEKAIKPLEYVRRLNTLHSLYNKLNNSEEASKALSIENTFVESVLKTSSEKTSRWLREKLGKHCADLPACLPH